MQSIIIKSAIALYDCSATFLVFFCVQQSDFYMWLLCADLFAKWLAGLFAVKYVVDICKGGTVLSFMYVPQLAYC